MSRVFLFCAGLRRRPEKNRLILQRVERLWPREVKMPIEQVTIERELYDHVHRFLSMDFNGVLARHTGAHPPQVFSDVVSKAGGEADGSWTRPDLAALAIVRGEFVPFLRADLHTFEVKTAKGLDVQGAHEASAQGRFGHYAWLVFQAVSRADRTTALFDQVLRSSVRLGVGVVTFKEPCDSNGWHVDAWPRLTATDDAIADEFVASRFRRETKNKIRKYLSGLKTGDNTDE